MYRRRFKRTRPSYIVKQLRNWLGNFRGNRSIAICDQMAKGFLPKKVSSPSGLSSKPFQLTDCQSMSSRTGPTGASWHYWLVGTTSSLRQSHQEKKKKKPAKTFVRYNKPPYFFFLPHLPQKRITVFELNCHSCFFLKKFLYLFKIDEEVITWSSAIIVVEKLVYERESQ